MTQRRSTVDVPAVHSVAAVGRIAELVGLVTVLAGLPVVVGLGTGFLTDAGTVEGAVALALGAMEEPLWSGLNRPALFHVATLAVLAGSWLLGAGLVIEGLYD